MVAPALQAFRLVADALGLLAMDTEAFMEEVKVKRLAAMGVERSHVEDLIQQRSDARQARDWGKADAIRDELTSLQIVVCDRPDGVDWRVAVGG